METESNSKTVTENCLKDKPDVKEADAVQEKEAQRVSISPPLVDLNSCEDTELEPEEVVDKQYDMVNLIDSKKAVAAIGGENWVGPHGERFCEKPANITVTCSDNSPSEEIPCVHSSYAESSKNTSLGPEFLPSGPSNCHSLTQGSFFFTVTNFALFLSVLV